MATIATLTIDLIGKSAKLTAELRKANKNTQSWADKTRKVVNSSAKVMAGFGVAGVAAFTAIYTKNAQFIDQQAKTADRLGLTTQALSGLHHAAEQTGASTEALNRGLQRMTRRIGQVAATGSGEAKVALDQLGISIDEIKSKSPDEQFALIAEKMADVSSQGQKVFLTQKLFDSEGVKLLNTLNLGADGIKAMMDEAEALGFAINRVDAAKVEMANDAFDRAQKSTHSFGQALATETAPIIAALSDMWTESAKEAGGFGQVAQNVVVGVAKGIGFLSDMGRGLQVVFMLVRQAVAEVWNAQIQLFNNVGQWGAGFLEKLGLDVSGAKNLQSFAESFNATTDQLGQELQNLLDEPMPSEKIKTWIADVQQKFQVAAEEQTKKNRLSLEDLLIDDEKKARENAAQEAQEFAAKGQSLVTSARNQYQQIYEAQLELEGKEAELENRAFERQKSALEKEFLELEKHYGSVTDLKKKIEAEKSSLKETGGDGAITWAENSESSKLYALKLELEQMSELENEYRLADEQLTIQHNARLAEIENQRNREIKQGYSELLGVMGSYFDGMEGKKAGYARVAISLGQTLLDEEKRNSIESIWTNTYDTAMKVYNALASIPIVGPALGSAAAGVVITAGTLYAAKASGVAGFEQGGTIGNQSIVEVGERNKPEVLSWGGRNFLLGGNGGAVFNTSQLESTTSGKNQGLAQNAQPVFNVHLHNYSGEGSRFLTRDGALHLIVGEMRDSTSQSREALHSSSNVKPVAAY